MTKEYDGRCSKDTFAESDDKAVIPQVMKVDPKMVVFLQVVRENENIIYVVGTEVNVTKDAIHQVLKSGTRITRPKQE